MTRELMLQGIRYIVYLNVVVSISTGVLSAGFASLIGLKEDAFFYGIFAFFSTFTVYNGQRLFKIVEAQTPWMLWVKRNKMMIQSLTAGSALIAVLCVLPILSLYEGYAIFYLFAIAMLVAVFYVIKVGGTNLRELPGVKIHLIAITWVIVLIVFPSMRYEIIDLNSFFLLCFAHYAYVLAVTIPFDIRDLKYDKPSQKTIPQVLGIRVSKALSVALLLVYAGLILFVIDPMLSNPLFYLAVSAQIVFVINMHSNRSDLYCAGGIDGAISLLGLAYFFT